MSGLAERLKTETRSLHTQLERGALMRCLLRGEMSRGAYGLLLRNLHAIYAALEPALERHAERPAVAAVYFPALFRAQALAKDLGDLHGIDWADDIQLVPAARLYVAHIHHLAAHGADLLVAHAYVRYLGDLSGGQLLRRIVAGSLHLGERHGPGHGTSFYDFGSPAEVRSHLQAWRSGLASVAAEPAAVESLVAEAVLAFELHQSLFDELAVAAGVVVEGAAEMTTDLASRDASETGAGRGPAQAPASVTAAS